MIIVLYFVFCRDNYRVFNVQHIIYDHRSSCFCLTEIKTVSLMVDRWSMITILHMCVFQTSYCVLIVWHIIYDLPFKCLSLPEFNSVFIICTTFNLRTSLFLFVSSRDKYRAPNVRHIIYNHSRINSCPQEINTVSVMFDISSMLTVVYDCFFHSSIPYHIVRHIIHDHTSLCLCFSELNIVSLLFDTWSMIIIVHGRVFQSCIPCL